MKVAFKDNVLTINSGIPAKTLVANAHISLAEDGKEVYAARFREGNVGNVDNYSLTANSIDAEGIAQAVMIMPTDYDLDDIKSIYGDALVNASKYLPKLAEQAAEYKATVDRIFNDIEA